MLQNFKNMKIIKTHYEERFSIELYDNNIIYIKWNSEFIDFKFIEDLTKKRLELTKNIEIKMISDISSVKSGTKEARKRLTKYDGLIGLKVLAIVCKSKVQQTLIQLINAIYKPNIETKVFHKKENAFNWILNQ